MPKTPKGIFSDKMDFMDGAILGLGKSYSLAEQWLLSQIIKEVLPELDVVDGQIKPTNTNITILTNKLNAVMEKLRKGRNNDIVDDIIKNMGGISNFNSRYFKLAGEAPKDIFDRAKKNANTIMQKSLGFNPDGSVKPNGFIDSVSRLDDINSNIREAGIRQIQGGNSVDGFINELEQNIVGDKDRRGILNRNRNQVVTDRYSQYDRAESQAFANELKMQAFIYSGGKVSDTRKFCCQRNGVIFTVEEAQYWNTINWQGKNRGYSPLIDMGGYNCRHSPQFISNKAAMRRRDDLTINDEGKLVSKQNRRQPPLNKGCTD